MFKSSRIMLKRINYVGRTYRVWCTGREKKPRWGRNSLSFHLTPNTLRVERFP